MEREGENDLVAHCTPVPRPRRKFLIPSPSSFSDSMSSAVLSLDTHSESQSEAEPSPLHTQGSYRAEPQTKRMTCRRLTSPCTPILSPSSAQAFSSYNNATPLFSPKPPTEGSGMPTNKSVRNRVTGRVTRTKTESDLPHYGPENSRRGVAKLTPKNGRFHFSGYADEKEVQHQRRFLSNELPTFRPNSKEDNPTTERRGGELSAEMNPSQRLSPLIRRRNWSNSGSSDQPCDALEESLFWNERYLLGRELGRGAFGVVNICMDRYTGEQCAVKKVLDDSIRYEQNVLRRGLDHPNITKYFKAIPNRDGSTSIYMEYVSGGSISKVVQEHGKLHFALVLRWAKGMLEGICYLHKLKILHRDIKGANVLITCDGIPKLTDFGCCLNLRDLSQTGGGLQGSVPWMAPEVLTEQKCSFQSDIWSFGATVVEMLDGQRPWPQVKEMVQLMLHIGTMQRHPPIPEEAPTEMHHFLKHCFQQQPTLRFSAYELLTEPIFESVKTRDDVAPPVTAYDHN